MKRWLLNIKNTINKAPLVKNIMIMGGGTGLAQLLPIISAPIVTRLYLPEHFGVYALYYSISTIIYGFSTLDYHNVIVVGENQEKSFLGMALSTLVALIIVSIVSLVFLIIPHNQLKILLGYDIQKFIFFIPITVLFNVINTVFYNWFLREGQYKFLSKNKIFISICSVCLQIGVGLLQIGTIGFIISNLAATFITILIMFLKFNKGYNKLYKTLKLIEIIKVAKIYKKFSLVSVWGNALNIITQQIPDFFLNKFFGSVVLGQYSLAQRMITLPSSFISASIQEVFRQTASKEQRETGNCINSYKKTFTITLILGVTICIAALTILPPIFIWFFGNKWVESSTYVRALCLLFAIKFIAPPLSYVFYIKNKPQIDFFWQIGLFVLSISVFGIAYFYFDITTPIILLFTYSTVLFLWYCFNLKLSYSLIKISKA